MLDISASAYRLLPVVHSWQEQVKPQPLRSAALLEAAPASSCSVLHR